MVILIRIILLTSENEHIRVSLISMSILVNCLFKPFAHFSVGLSAILVWMVGVLLFGLHMSSSSSIQISNISSHSISYLFTLTFPDTFHSVHVFQWTHILNFKFNVIDLFLAPKKYLSHEGVCLSVVCLFLVSVWVSQYVCLSVCLSPCCQCIFVSLSQCECLFLRLCVSFSLCICL